MHLIGYKIDNYENEKSAILLYIKHISVHNHFFIMLDLEKLDKILDKHLEESTTESLLLWLFKNNLERKGQTEPHHRGTLSSFYQSAHFFSCVAEQNVQIVKPVISTQKKAACYNLLLFYGTDRIENDTANIYNELREKYLNCRKSIKNERAEMYEHQMDFVLYLSNKTITV